MDQASLIEQLRIERPTEAARRGAWGWAASIAVGVLVVGAALSCLVALPLALPFTATARDLLLLGLLGVFQLGLPCMLLVIASRSLRAPEIALLGLIEVVLGPLLAWLGAGETPAIATLAGGAIVLAALAGNELAALAGRSRAA